MFVPFIRRCAVGRDVRCFALFSSARGAYYPVAPCRFFDTRSNATGGPALKALITRTINIAPLSACGIPSTAQAYVLNATVAPASKLGYLRILPAGAPASSSATSTLNALTGTVVANTAIVGAGEQGAIDVFAIDDTHLILDVNGYFAPPGEPGGLNYYPVKPCRLLDSRLSPPLYGFPKLTAYAITPNQPLACIPPAAAKAWSLNATVLPTDGPLGWFALGPGDIYYYNYKPLFSTLNALDGGITANAVIVEAPGRYLSIFLSDSAHLILDLNGFFAQ